MNDRKKVNSMDELVSIIVPIYKTEEYMDECIESIIVQTYEKIEIILVDDGSPDACPGKCDIWKEKDERVKVVHQKNQGVSGARNAGIRCANGKWLLFVDSDDAIPNNFIEMLIKSDDGGKKLLASKILRFSDEIPTYIVKQDEPSKTGKDLSIERGGMFACGILYNRKLVNEINLIFDDSLVNLEDVVWNGIYLRYVEPSDVVYVDVPYYYRMTPNSITSQCYCISWQIESWIAARRALMNWFAKKKMTKVQVKGIKKIYRYCQNNIYDEIRVGNIGFSELQKIEKRVEFQYCKKNIPFLERILMNYMPRIYYWFYQAMLMINEILRKRGKN